MKGAGISVEDVENRVKWRLRFRVAEPKKLGETAKENM